MAQARHLQKVAASSSSVVDLQTKIQKNIRIRLNVLQQPFYMLKENFEKTTALDFFSLLHFLSWVYFPLLFFFSFFFSVVDLPPYASIYIISHHSNAFCSKENFRIISNKMEERTSMRNQIDSIHIFLKDILNFDQFFFTSLYKYYALSMID